MNEALKNQWVANLRSGKFSQGHSALATVDDKFCCLGVFCEIAPEVDREEHPNGGDVIFKYKGSVDLFYLPTALADEYFEGLTNPPIELWGDLKFSDNGSQSVTLAQLNDGGFTFKQIADVIDYFL